MTARQQEVEAIPDVAAIFKMRSLSEWLDLFKSLDACIEPVRDFSSVFDDPHVRHRGLVAELDVPGIGKIPQIGSVFVFAPNSSTPPPRLGQHTRSVLAEIGMDESQVAVLERAGVVKTVR
jgi:crotonobetainyl-CoA:carnitine CoA-transferase CaiB-like acyl-CoA transferase